MCLNEVKTKRTTNFRTNAVSSFYLEHILEEYMIIKQIGEMRSDHMKIILHEDDFNDEYFWEFVDTMDLIHQIIPIQHIVDFEQSGGLILLEDQCEDLNRFQHRVRLSAWHTEAKWLTWIQLVSQQPNFR